MSSKFTSGPWLCSNAGELFGPELIRDCDGSLPLYKQADARLIAAAPELLDATKLLLELIADDNGAALGPGLLACTQAIRKAEGFEQCGGERV